ncbi:amidohydrolase family protein [Sphingomonas bacterium]|uniref:amidohydrolase family protein n=1 Tax=Sphingomonas bacterium TaxID=1895847 RepID=UPI001C2DCA21|nr:amidohydrolase family protein [Sphingomonas bacterium]
MPIIASRRAILGAGLTAIERPALAARADEPDLIVRNACIHTVDDGRPSATTLAVRDGRFVAVGGDEVAGLAGKATRTIDAKGMTIVPGFIDCHNHASGDVLLYEVLVGNPFDVEFVTIASIVDKLRTRAAVTPPGQWIDGFFYDDTKVKDGRLLTAADLDAVSRVHPVWVHHRGGHTGFFNSFALRRPRRSSAARSERGCRRLHALRGAAAMAAARCWPWPRPISPSRHEGRRSTRRCSRCRPDSASPTPTPGPS